MAVLQQYAAILLIGWASGISLYLAVALAGISGRMGWLELPGGLDILTHPFVIGAALFMYAIEFFADKIPLVDSAWDSVHTFIRPTGAAIVGFLAGTEHGALAQTVLAVLTGAIALDTHAIKASSRVAINTSPEPVTNIAASVTEDAVVVGVFWFFIKHPVLATVALVCFLVASFFILRFMWRFVLKVFRNPRRSAVPGDCQSAPPAAPTKTS